MKKLVIILFVFLTWVGMAGADTFFVRKDGHDTNCAGTDNVSDSSTVTTACAKLTIQAMIDVLPAGTHTIQVGAGSYEEGTFLYFNSGESNKNITIQPSSGSNDVTITSTNGSYAVLLNNDLAGGSLTLNRLNITGAKTTALIRSLASTTNLTISNSTLNNDAAGIGSNVVEFTDLSTTATSILTFSGNTVTATGTPLYINSGISEISGNNITFTGDLDLNNGVFINAGYRTASSTIVNNTFTARSNITAGRAIRCVSVKALTSYAEYVRVENNVMNNCGNLVEDSVRELVFKDNTVTVNSGNVAGGINVGAETSPARAMESTSIIGNTITLNSTSGGGHGLFFGPGQSNAVITRNKIYQVGGMAYNYVIKGSNVTFAYNSGYGPWCIYLPAAENVTVYNNVCNGGSGYGFDLDKNGVNGLGTSCANNNSIKNNIFLSDSVAAMIVDPDGSDNCGSKTNVFDYNLYHTTTGGIVGFASNLYTGLIALLDKWVSFAASTPNNDANSRLEDPLLSGRGGLNYSLTYLSPAIDAGTTTAYTTDILGNDIYGLPDIGAYEYQPPYDMDNALATSSVRVYGDEKWRPTTATTSADIADLDVAIEGSDKTDWLDVDISTWESDGAYQKTFTASTTVSDLAVTFTVGDLSPNHPYTLTIDGGAPTNYTADENGEISFSYSGPWSLHTFDILGDTTGPVRSAGSPSVEQPAGTTQAALSLTTDETATCKYSLTADTAYDSMTPFTTTNSTSHSTTVTGLQDGRTYTYYVRCANLSEVANDTDYIISFSTATPASSSGFRRTPRPAVAVPVQTLDREALVQQLQARIQVLLAQLRALLEARGVR